ncbi:MAG: hypothetical protein ISP01_00605 [Methanobrevibacter arboriphilus]|uniref:Uncharacterized protein n=1 Tax=Methanobrevibacter arboriphilus TaxID=39441 RepID=A0A843ALZ2_METAZ|nr:hypothetical protein [Methanobrevibacter arboriphilus]MBF4467880.1 hypothetical protein [Methanobrevibacter arboriphilus]
MEKNKKIILGIIIAIIVVVGLISVISIISEDKTPHVSMGGKTYYVGDKLVYQDLDNKSMVEADVIAIEGKYLWSKIPENNKTVYWDTEKEQGWTINNTDT